MFFHYPKSISSFVLLVATTSLLQVTTGQRSDAPSPQSFWTKSYHTSDNRRRQVTNPEPFRNYRPPLPTTEEPPSKLQRAVTNLEESFHHQQNCRLNKIKLESTQYVQYVVNFPPLKQFHFCLWLKTFNLTTEHVLFSYSVPQNPDMITMWISPIQNQTGFHMVLNGIKIYNLNYVIPIGKWLHICQSWNGNSGHWGIFVNSVPIGDGYGPAKLIGFQIPGGGRPVTGRGQDLASNNELSQGIQGEMTLFEMDDVGLEGSTILRPLQSDCVPRHRGNLISWGKSHLKLFGGAEIYGVEPICASFPE